MHVTSTEAQTEEDEKGEPDEERSSTKDAIQWTDKDSGLLAFLEDAAEPTQEVIDYLQYGLLSPNTHRGHFLKLSQHLDDQARGMVITLCCGDNDKEAILSHLNMFPDDTAWLPAVRSFLGEHMVQEWHPNVEDVFPISLMPLCFPNHEILTWCHFAPLADLSLERLARRLTFCQIRLDADLQARAKASHERMPDDEIAKLKGGHGKLSSEFRKRHYQLLMADNYVLFNVEGGAWDPGRPYNQEDIETLLQDFKDRRPVRLLFSSESQGG